MQFPPAPLTATAVHLCVDMQRLFAPGAIWSTPWSAAALPQVVELARRFPERTIFTRFLPPRRPSDMPGTWQDFYRHWHRVTRQEIEPGLLRLHPELEALSPPAEIIDKPTYSAFVSRRLAASLRNRAADTLIVTGAESEMCVLATVLAAVDRGYRVVLVADAVCSSSDRGHDAIMAIYRERFARQIEVAAAETVLALWT